MTALKRLRPLLLSLLAFSLLGCQPQSTAPQAQGTKPQPAPASPLRIATLKGPTAMAFVDLLPKTEGEHPAYTLHFEATPDALIPALLKGEVDLASLPANLAATLFNKTKGQIAVVATTVNGNLALLGRSGPLSSVDDLKGKTLYAPGRGATPEWILTALLQQAGLSPDDLHIEWKAEAAEVIPALMAHPEAYALLPQPFATVAQSKVEGLAPVLDLNAIWESHQHSDIIMGVLVARKEAIAQQGPAIQTLISDLRHALETHGEATYQALEAQGILPAPLAAKAWEACNLVVNTGKPTADALRRYLETLYAIEPKSIGGQLPDVAFYQDVEAQP